ncbi:hypothetical protein [Fodinicola feengrottensis]|uniref:hypothetical protein n=1 Tax=Fodinicola feengrottensis TaxID=435914 RepID=UPI002442E936|nr:hypothetical protein [Fodinicola feengrottensis]
MTNSLVTSDMMMSVDGYAAGLNQRADDPFGDGVHKILPRWMFEAADENAEEIKNICVAGAYVMGRNMFGPDRGDWDLDWTGPLVGPETALPRAGLRARPPRAGVRGDGGRHDFPLRDRRHH